MKTLPADYSFCTDKLCPLKDDCLRLIYPNTNKPIAFVRFSYEWDEGLKKYVCKDQITYEDYFGFKRAKDES